MPQQYLEACTPVENLKLGEKRQVVLQTQVMSLPCSNSTDARSVPVTQVKRGQELETAGVIRNSEGMLWYEISYGGKTCYLYTGYAEECYDLEPELLSGDLQM